MNLEVYRSIGGYVVRKRNGAGQLVAEFYDPKALDAFVSGLALDEAASLYDRDAGKYLVGDLNQLVGGA